MISYEQYVQFSPYFAQQDIEKGEERNAFFKTLDKLPPKIKDILVSMDTAEKIINIGKAFGLDEFDTEAFSFSIRKIAAGEIFIGDGTEFIAGEAGLPSERAKNLLSLIVNEVFAPALEDIKKVQTSKFSQRFGTPASADIQTPQTQTRSPIKQPGPTQSDNPNVINLRNR